MKVTPRLAAILFVINALWGPVGLAVKIAQDEWTASAISAVRWVAVVALVWGALAFAPVRATLRVRWPHGRDRWVAAVLGLTMIAPAHLIYYIALSQTSSVEATALGISAPLWIALFGVVLLGERVTIWRWAALVLGGIGCYVVAAGFGPPNLDAAHARGNALYLIGVFVEALGVALAARIVKRSSGVGALAFQLLGVATGALIFPILFGGPVAFGMTGASPATIGAIAYLVLIASIVCWGTWYALAERAPISLLVVASAIQPPVAGALGAWLLGEAITFELLSGGTIVLASLLLAAAADRTPA